MMYYMGEKKYNKFHNLLQFYYNLFNYVVVWYLFLKGVGVDVVIIKSLTLYGCILLVIGFFLSPTDAYCYAHYGRTYYQQDTNHNHDEPCHIHAKHCTSGLTCKSYKNSRKNMYKISQNT